MLEHEIERRLTTRLFGRRIFTFESIDSTNTFGKSIGDKAAEGTLVVAEEQTAGRGRLGRAWHAERGKNLTFSLILRPPMPPEYLGVLSLYAGLAVADAIRAETRLNPECKWPNDILIGGKKCAGILLESSIAPGPTPAGDPALVVIGIGLNVNQTDFPVPLRTAATSLSLECGGKTLDRPGMLAAVLLQLERWYEPVRAGNYQQVLAAWQLQAPMLGRHIRVSSGGTTLAGIARRVDPDGALVLQLNDRELKLTAGDISISDEERV